MPNMFFWLVGIISSFFGFILEFLKDYIKRKALSFPYFMAVVSINLILLPIVSLYFYSVIKLILFVYNGVKTVINFLNSNIGGSEASNLLNNLLMSVRFYDALSDVFTIFSPILSTVFLIISYKFGIKNLITIRTSLISVVISKLS